MTRFHGWQKNWEAVQYYWQHLTVFNVRTEYVVIWLHRVCWVVRFLDNKEWCASLNCFHSVYTIQTITQETSQCEWYTLVPGLPPSVFMYRNGRAAYYNEPKLKNKAGGTETRVEVVCWLLKNGLSGCSQALAVDWREGYTHVVLQNLAKNCVLKALYETAHALTGVMNLCMFECWPWTTKDE